MHMYNRSSMFRIENRMYVCYMCIITDCNRAGNKVGKINFLTSADYYYVLLYYIVCGVGISLM